VGHPAERLGVEPRDDALEGVTRPHPGERRQDDLLGGRVRLLVDSRVEPRRRDGSGEPVRQQDRSGAAQRGGVIRQQRQQAVWDRPEGRGVEVDLGDRRGGGCLAVGGGRGDRGRPRRLGGRLREQRGERGGSGDPERDVLVGEGRRGEPLDVGAVGLGADRDEPVEQRATDHGSGVLGELGEGRGGVLIGGLRKGSGGGGGERLIFAGQGAPGRLGGDATVGASRDDERRSELHRPRFRVREELVQSGLIGRWAEPRQGAGRLEDDRVVFVREPRDERSPRQ